MKRQMKLMAGVLGLTGVLASCGTAPSDNLGEMPTIAGKLSNYTQGAKVVKVGAGGQNPVVTTGVLNADGSFNVVLPTPRAADLTASFAVKCLTGTSESSAPDAKTGFAVSGVFNDATSTTAIGSLIRGTPFSTQPAVVGTKGKFALHVYADKELTFTYKDCNLGQGQGSVNVYNGTATLKAGWNVVYQEFEVLEVSTISPTFPTKTKTTIGMGASGLDWRLETGTGAPFRSPLSIQ